MQREADFAPLAECLILSDLPLLPWALQRLSVESCVWEPDARRHFSDRQAIKIKLTLSR